METRKYYEAYDERYRQVHAQGLQWASDMPSAIVEQTMRRWGIQKDQKILEIGCGEGRDAEYLLRKGYDLLATDVSPEAIAYCKKRNTDFAENFRVLDCIGQRLGEKFDFIYAVAVIHMLVKDDDRAAFFRFVREQLTEKGIGLICTMGDGETERCSDVRTAFDLQKRVHTQSGKTLVLAGTSCRMVGFDTFLKELNKNGLQVCDHGLTAVEPDFPVMMYAVVKRAD